jgi:hypothetical protein
MGKPSLLGPRSERCLHAASQERFAAASRFGCPLPAKAGSGVNLAPRLPGGSKKDYSSMTNRHDFDVVEASTFAGLGGSLDPD